MADIFGKKINPRAGIRSTPRQRTALSGIKKPAPDEGLTKTGEFVLGKSKTDDGSGAEAKRFPNDIDDFLSKGEVSF